MRERLRALIAQGVARMRGGAPNPRRTAASMGFGLFVGFMPLYGLQTAICLTVGLALRLDVPLILFATLVANPLTAPFLLALELELGALVVTGRWLPLRSMDLSVRMLGEAFGYTLLGGALVGSVAGALGALLTFAWMQRRMRRTNLATK